MEERGVKRDFDRYSLNNAIGGDVSHDGFHRSNPMSQVQQLFSSPIQFPTSALPLSRNQLEPVITFPSQQIVPVRRNKIAKRVRIEDMSNNPLPNKQASIPVNDLSKGLNNMKVLKMKLLKDVEEAYRKNVRMKVCNCLDLKMNVAQQCNNMLLYATLRILIDKS